jgi:hypothetical protein
MGDFAERMATSLYSNYRRVFKVRTKIEIEVLKYGVQYFKQDWLRH